MPDHPTRVAPAGLTLPIPLHVKVASVGLGLVTVALGLVYLLDPPQRLRVVETRSVVAVLEPVLGWTFLAVGAWVVLANVATVARASAHGVAAVAHGCYTVALIVTVLLTHGAAGNVTAVLSTASFIAHAAVCISYWQRGYR